ncbi:zinc transporter 5 [Prunus yedoensis var. nudiflora]|uniref:Zinc transporter 5 n=1 Tax=Prunus yedoensis var. nudiflora TaxID=2094558 RepID=A0A314XNH1_PRUYE|nr:zinc transporter 5 [Prunus yedoensis var. nudiflora]
MEIREGPNMNRPRPWDQRPELLQNGPQESLMSRLMGSSTQQPHIITETEQLKKLNLVEKKLYPAFVSKMMSPRQIPEDRGSSPHFRHTPLQIIHIIGNFLRIWSIYSLYRYLSETGASVVLFLFTCLIPASILFLILQKPWKGRPLSNTQVVPSIINGGITALYFVLWGKGLKSCGPLRAILAEYSGAVLGVLSGVLYGRKGHIWKKVGGLIAMVASFYFLSQGWAMATYSPFYILSYRNYSLDDKVQTEQVLGIKEMVLPIFAGILSALRRVIARRVSLKNQLKRRLNAITIASATCFLFPVAMWDMIIGSPSSTSDKVPFSTWAFLSTILFGVILIFYVDSIAEERLHMVFSSPRHLMVAGGCIIVMEIVYNMDFSLPGFLICCLILGFGIHEATSLERGRKDSFQTSDLSNGMLGDEIQMSSLPT